MSIFKTKGFDTVISKETMLIGEMCFSGVTVVDGIIEGQSIRQNTVDAKKSSLHVNGSVQVNDVIVIHDLVICGNVTAKTIHVEGTLAVKSGAKLTADVVYYRTLHVEPGSVIIAKLEHLDHVSAGEKV